MNIRSLKWHQRNRPEQYQFVKTEFSTEEDLIVRAHVKVGKRVMVVIDRLIRNQPEYDHIFISSWNRKDCAEQERELLAYGISVFRGHRDFANIKNHLASCKREGRKVIFHIDESDFGTGDKQNFAKNVYADLLSYKNGQRIFYSATNEEIINSNYSLCSGKKCKVVTFPNPEGFFGADKFLAKGLVQEATDFFEDGRFTNQGKECLELLRQADQDTAFGIVRFAKKGTYESNINHPNFVKVLRQLKIKIIRADQDNNFYFGPEEHWDGKIRPWFNEYSGKYLIVLNQGCTRSTEMSFHPLLTFWHECRGPSTPHSTLAQSSLRASHYPQAYYNEKWREIWGNHSSENIKIFAEVATFQKQADMISDIEYSTITNKSLSPRVGKISSNKPRSIYIPDSNFQVYDTVAAANKFLDEYYKKMGLPKPPGSKISRTKNSNMQNVANDIFSGKVRRQASYANSYVAVEFNGPPLKPKSPKSRDSYYDVLKIHPEWQGKVVIRFFTKTIQTKPKVSNSVFSKAMI